MKLYQSVVFYIKLGNSIVSSGIPLSIPQRINMPKITYVTKKGNLRKILVDDILMSLIDDILMRNTI